MPSARPVFLPLLTGIILAAIAAPPVLAQEGDDEPEAKLDDAKKSRHDILIFARALVWLPELSGDVALNNAVGFATDLSFDSDLGVGDSETEVAWEVNLRFGWHDVRISGFTFGVDGIEAASTPIEFGNISFNPGEFINTEFDATNLKVLHGFSPFNIEDHGFRLGTLIGLNFYDIDINVTDVAMLTDDAISEQIPLPVIGVYAEVPIGQFLFSGEVSGLSLSVSNVQALYFDASVSLTWRPLPMVGLSAGYRSITAQLETDDFDVDADLQGWFFGGEIRF